MSPYETQDPKRAETLTASDLKRMARFQIDSELIALTGIRRVTSAEARIDCGVRFKGDIAGVAYPVMGACGATVAWRVRRDNPEMEKDKPKNKWVHSQDRSHLC